MSNSLVFLATSHHPDVPGWVCGHTSMWQCWNQLSKVFILTIIRWHSNILSNAKREAGRRRTQRRCKCWKLERIINADAPSELKLEDLLNEEAGREGDNAKDAEEVTFIH